MLLACQNRLHATQSRSMMFVVATGKVSGGRVELTPLEVQGTHQQVCMCSQAVPMSGSQWDSDSLGSG